MAFWLTDAITSEPKRNFRWYMVFGSDSELNQFVYALKKVDLPKASIKETEHQYLNHKFYYPGRLEWNPITLTMASVTNKDAGAALYRALQNAGYGPPANSDPGRQLATISKKAMGSVIGDSLNINQIDSDGNVLSNYQLFNPFFTEVTWGSLDYTSEDITELSMTIRYDYAKYNIEAEVGDQAELRPNTLVPTI